MSSDGIAAGAPAGAQDFSTTYKVYVLLLLLAVYIIREGLYMLRRQRAAHHRLTG